MNYDDWKTDPDYESDRENREHEEIDPDLEMERKQERKEQEHNERSW